MIEGVRKGMTLGDLQDGGVELLEKIKEEYLKLYENNEDENHENHNTVVYFYNFREIMMMKMILFQIKFQKKVIDYQINLGILK